MISGSVLTPAFGAERENGSSADGVLSGLTDQYVCRLPPDSFPSLSARSRKPWIPETTPPPAAPPGTLPAAGRRAFLCVEGERTKAESHRQSPELFRAAGNRNGCQRLPRAGTFFCMWRAKEQGGKPQANRQRHPAPPGNRKGDGSGAGAEDSEIQCLRLRADRTGKVSDGGWLRDETKRRPKAPSEGEHFPCPVRTPE